MKTLPDDEARCSGVAYEEDGEIHWREGCERCLRRLAPGGGPRVRRMEPPLIIAFECEYLLDDSH